MIEKFSDKITKFVFNNNSLEYDDNRSLWIRYGIELLLSSIIGIVLSLIISIIIANILIGIIFSSVFIIERSFTGGYHAEKYISCIATFLATEIIVMIVAKFSSILDGFQCYLWIPCALGLVVIVVLSPVNNKYKPTASNSRKMLLKICSGSSYLILLIIAIIMVEDYSYEANTIICTLLSVSILCVIGFLKERRRK